jgi:hypothetical protein
LQAKIVGLLLKRKELAHEFLLFVRKLERQSRFSVVEMGNELFAQGKFSLGRLVACSCTLGDPVPALFRPRKIGENQLGIDHFNVAHRIDRAAHVMNVAVFKAAHDLHDRVHFADVTEELVAQPFACAGPGDEARDVHKLDRRGHELLGAGKLRQHLQPRIGNDHHADIRVDRAKRIIGRLRLSGSRNSIEQGRFTDVGKTDDAGGKHE